MVIRVHVVVVGDDGRQELGTGEAEQLLKHLQVSETIGTKTTTNTLIKTQRMPRGQLGRFDTSMRL